MIVFKSNEEVLSDILNFALSHIIIVVEIIVIVWDVVDDVGSVSTLAVLSCITITLWLTIIS